jgi:Icc-related predicted phosphoesterase
MMRIYAVADIHGRHDRIEGIERRMDDIRPDLLVVAGDITHFTRPGPVIERLGRMPVPVLAIRGNTDLKRVEGLMAARSGIEALNGRKMRIGEISFVGVSGTVPLPFRSQIGLRERRILEKIEPLLNRDDIFVAHPPPWGTLDEVLGKWHAGSKNLSRFLQRRCPKLLICGHIHERPGEARLGQTRVVNCALSQRSDGAIIDYEAGGEPKIEMLAPPVT